MNPYPHESAREVLVVFDDQAASASVLEWSSTLASVTRRDLAVVYVENTIALRAAALPITRVLAHAGASWTPFGPEDLERAYRVQAERLRVRAEQVARRHAVRVRLRMARGAPAQAAFALAGETALVLLGVAQARRPGASPGSPHVLLFDEATPSAWLRTVAQDVARSIGGTFTERRVDAAQLCTALADVQADLVVLPRHLAQPAALAAARQPLLIVGAPPDDTGREAST